MTRLWARIIQRHRIARQATVECTFEEAQDALTEICHELDIARPLWLRKHENEYGSM